MKEATGSKKTIVRVESIEGECPVYSTDEEFILKEGYRLNTDGLELCMHSLGAILPFYNTLRFAEPGELGLEGENKDAFVQCPDPCDYTGGGTVVFRLKRDG